MKIERNPRTDSDVRVLREVFPDLVCDGRVITHEQIEAVLADSHLSARYRRVVARWRREVFHERGVYLDGQTAQGRGLVCLTPDEMVRFGNRGVRVAGRKLQRALAVALAPDVNQLSEHVRRYQGALCVAMERIALEHKTALRDVSRALAPMKQLPRKVS